MKTGGESKVLAPLVAANLRRARERAELSQSQLAARAALTAHHIGQIENGKSGLTLGTIERLAQAMGVDPLDLFKRRK